MVKIPKYLMPLSGKKEVNATSLYRPPQPITKI